MSQAGQPKPVFMPSFGVIKGGRLNGWRYHFLHFKARGADLLVVARCTPPNWPFPCDIAMDHTHFMQLRAVPGERAKRMRAEPLIASAFQLEGREVPQWLTERAMTLRARVKRSSGAKRGMQ
jgi:hypothetical protein